ncbi:MAG: peptidyl-prolyl cis-trans isomerase [Candidatus Symbiothrix sp.]|jgi:hypothetical protein|nr:peptidyl-prolyl cis-trans isomerase [Candidatus Symbiothrix sp.]
MRLIIPLVVVSLLAVACNNQPATEVSVIVKVNDKVLSKKDLDDVISKGLSPEDSTIAAEHFIRLWINDNLMYSVAAKNVTDKKSLDHLVENYRQSLTVYQYKEQLVNEKLSTEITNSSLLEYYEKNKDKFKIDRPLIKGLFLKIPVNASQIEKVRIWYKSLTPANITNIENYCVRNVVEYGYFVDNWIDFYELANEWPVNYKNENEILQQQKYFEQKGSHFYYLLNVTDFLLPGDNAPFEYAKPTIREILINQQKTDFLKNIEDDLYRKALNNGDIIFYNE